LGPHWSYGTTPPFSDQRVLTLSHKPCRNGGKVVDVVIGVVEVGDGSRGIDGDVVDIVVHGAGVPRSCEVTDRCLVDG
jgi:hypothetical protein